MKYKLFTTKWCPKCPSMKEFMKTLEIEGRNIDASEGNGLSEAIKHKVHNAPTVIFFNNDNKEIFRTSKKNEVIEWLKKKC